MKSVTMLKVLAVCAISSLSLAGGAAQAGDSCILSSLTRSAASAEGADGHGGCGEANQDKGNSCPVNQDKAASRIAPLVGSVAKEGVQTATSVMGALVHEAGLMLRE